MQLGHHSTTAFHFSVGRPNRCRPVSAPLRGETPLASSCSFLASVIKWSCAVSMRRRKMAAAHIYAIQIQVGGPGRTDEGHVGSVSRLLCLARIFEYANQLWRKCVFFSFDLFFFSDLHAPFTKLNDAHPLVLLFTPPLRLRRLPTCLHLPAVSLLLPGRIGEKACGRRGLRDR